jgi:hypothetical protein
MLFYLYITVAVSFGVGIRASEQSSYDKTPWWALILCCVLWPVFLPLAAMTR